MKDLIIEILKRNNIEVDQETIDRIVARCEASFANLDTALSNAGAGASPELFDIERGQKDQWELRWVLKEHAGIM